MPRATTAFDQLSTGAVAERAGVAVSTIHFYEANGLITSTRTSSDRRRYSRDTLRRIAFIRASQRVGISLGEIREALAALPEGRTPTPADWARLSKRWQSQLDERIEQLERLRDDLSRCIGCGCLSFQTCRLANPWDALAKEGPGARRLLPGSPRPDR